LPVLAFVMINVKVGTDRETVVQLKAIKGVREVDEVYAVYDIVAIVEAETMEKLNDIVNVEIRKIENVTSTSTLLADRYA
jgi:DNA-binding Lrp family transcriptional regulator